MVPKTNVGKIFCLVFMCIGIPYFACMTAELSSRIEKCLERARLEISPEVLKISLEIFKKIFGAR